MRRSEEDRADTQLMQIVAEANAKTSQVNEETFGAPFAQIISLAVPIRVTVFAGDG